MTPEFDYKSYPIVIVDDDPDILATFRFAFEDQFIIHSATNGPDALALIGDHSAAVLVADQRMPGMHGVEVISSAVERYPNVVPIVLTGFTDYGDLVKAMNIGRVFRYIPKPWNAQELRHALELAVERHHLGRENTRLTRELQAANEQLAQENVYLKGLDNPEKGLAAIIGESDAITALRTRVRKIMGASATVLINGPTGTGKELVAQAIHYDGPRRERLFAAVNCAILSDELLASQLFGHRKGAFTGALETKGLFQLADGGTVFLDEISETSPELQAKLLRVLAERAVQPVGDLARTIPVDVQVIAATNRDLEAEVKAGRFREDLFFRLNVLPISIPPLSARRDDISLLVDHFLRLHAAVYGRRTQGVSADALVELEQREYRGNIRELSNLIERGVLLSDPGGTITAEHLFDRPVDPTPPRRSGAPSLSATVLRFEKSVLVEALRNHGGSRTQTAEALDITPRWLGKLMKRHGLGRNGE